MDLELAQQILNLLPAAVYTCDQEGRITYFNQCAADLWRRQPKLNDAEDKYCGSFRLVAPDGSSMPLSTCPMAIAVKTGKSFRNGEVAVQRPDGSRVSVRVNIDPLYDEHGRRCGAINMFRDVTGSHRAEQASRHLAALVESSDDAIITKDLNSIITSWNPAAERLFGYSAGEINGKRVTLLIPPEHQDEESNILERIRRGERIEHYETVRQRKDKSLVEISLTVSPIRNAQGQRHWRIENRSRYYQAQGNRGDAPRGQGGIGQSQ